MKVIQTRLLNKTELRVFKSIERHIKKYEIANNLRVFPQVALNILIPREVAEQCFDASTHNDPQGFYMCSSVDVVLYDINYNLPILVIEVQGRSHYRPVQKIRDNLKLELLTVAGILLLYINDSQGYKYDMDKFMKEYMEKMYAKK